MTDSLLKSMLYQEESETLDFKEEQYDLKHASTEKKSEVIKDILIFANAWKTSDAHILIGVRDKPGERKTVVGVTHHLDDANLQQLVNSKTNRPVRFAYVASSLDGHQVGVIRIDTEQDRPIYLTKGFGKLRKDVVYVRRGTSTAEATPAEVADMGAVRSESQLIVPTLDLQFADGDSRTALGTAIEMTSVILVDPPPATPASPEELRAVQEFVKGAGGLASRTRSLDTSRALARVSLGNLKPFAPSEEELRAYRERIGRLHSMAFYVKNTGSVTATGIAVEITGETADGLEVLDFTDAPLYPSGIGLSIPPGTLKSAIGVKKHGTTWCAEFTVPKLQPKAEFWSEAHLFIGATRPVTVTAVATVYADNLPQPLEYPMEINIATEERIYRPEEFEEG